VKLPRAIRQFAALAVLITVVAAVPLRAAEAARYTLAARIVSVHPRTLRIYEDEGLIEPARTPTNIRLYSDEDIRRILWIRHLTQERGANLAGIRILFELEERLGVRILEALYDEGTGAGREDGAAMTEGEARHGT